ncbi:MAG TPA: hypothetical protein VJ907_02840 [Halanaerobiales bacterium]|nr:hypothetical protein [Halanaerobiales bacterium]
MNKKTLLVLSLTILLTALLTLAIQAEQGQEYSKEMQHFTYTYYQKDEPINEINNRLEKYYNKILNKYNVKLNRQVKITIYPDVNSFHKGAKVTNKSPGIVGKAISSYKIAFVSPLNPGKVHNYESILKIAVHEFVHISTNKINRNIPIWLNEGISLYEAEQVNPNHIKQIIRAEKVPTIKDLESNFYENFGYTVSGTIVEYIVDMYSYDKLIRLIKSPSNYKGIFGLSKEAFFSNWKGYLYKNYE